MASHLPQNSTPITSQTSDDNYLFENVNDAVFIHDLAGNFLRVNEIACRRLGYTHEELLRIPLSQLDSPENADRYTDRIQYLQQHGNMILESQHRCKDGELIPVEVNARLIVFNDALAVLSIVRDITERKRVEKELRQQTERLAIIQNQTSRALELLETLLANAPIGICFYDTELRYLDVNPCLAQMNGVPIEETIGRSVAEVLPGFAPAIEPLVRIVLSTGQPVLNIEIAGYVPAPPNQLVYHQVSYYPVRDALNNIQGIGGIVKDITQIKQAEQALRNAEEKYRNIFENAVEGIFQSTADGRYLSVNSAMARIYGYSSPEEMVANIGNDIEYKIYAEPGRRAEFIRQLEKHGVVQDFEAPNLRQDGMLIWTNTNARAVRDSDRQLMYYEGFVEDITERKRTLEALRKSEERFAAQYKNFPLPTYTWRKVDQDFVLIDYNDAAYKITKGEIPNLLKITASAFYQDEPDILKDLARCFWEQITLRREMKMRMRSTEQFADFIVTYAYVPPDLVMVHTEDITQRKQAEAALRDSEARYRMLMEQAADGISVTDSQAHFIDCNSAVCSLLGYTRDEFLRLTVADILAFGSLDQVPIPFDALRQGKTIVLERIMRRKNGTLVPVDVRIKMLPDGTFQAIYRDISERKQLEDALHTMLEQQRKWNVDLQNQVQIKTAELRRLSETRDQLLRQIIIAQEEEHRRVARELHDETSQALTALIANLAVVQTLSPSKAKAHLDEIKGSVVDILKGINQIVLDLRPTLLDDYGLMPALSWYANKRLGSSVRIELASPEPEVRLPSTIETTLFRIGQEALANVAQHAKAKCVQMRLHLADSGNQITLEVEDNGSGFSVEQAKQQEQSDRLHLGLLGMQERVQLIGGQLQIESTPGKGTLIAVSVPLSNPADEE